MTEPRPSSSVAARPGDQGDASRSTIQGFERSPPAAPARELVGLYGRPDALPAAARRAADRGMDRTQNGSRRAVLAGEGYKRHGADHAAGRRPARAGRRWAALRSSRRDLRAPKGRRCPWPRAVTACMVKADAEGARLAWRFRHRPCACTEASIRADLAALTPRRRGRSNGADQSVHPCFLRKSRKRPHAWSPAKSRACRHQASPRCIGLRHGRGRSQTPAAQRQRLVLYRR